jgi:hypothetical protein
MRAAAVSLILLMLSMPVSQAAAPVFPELGIAISPDVVYVNASPYYQQIQFNGTATLDNPSQSPIVVSLFGRVSVGWVPTCAPNVFSLWGPDSIPFTLTIRVDQGACNMTVIAWVEGEARFNGAIVSTNQSSRSTIILGDLPGYSVSANKDDPWLASTFGGNVPFSPGMALLIAIIAIVAIATYGLARRRRKRRGAG